MKGTTGGSISILNLMEVVVDKIQSTSFDTGACDYFRALSQQSFPGPLIGGNAATKDLYKWIDERIANCQSSNMDFKKGELSRLILSLLKICCQHYGKLRSPFGVDSALQVLQWLFSKLMLELFPLHFIIIIYLSFLIQ